jgi:hypothetical protein
LNFELKLPIPKIPGLGFEGLEFDSLGHMGLRGLEFESLVFREGLGFEALVSEMHQIRGVVSEVLGLRLSWVSVWVSNCWAHIKLIHGPTVTPQFPCLEDYGNFYVLRGMDQTPKAYPNSEDSKAFEALLV